MAVKVKGEVLILAKDLLDYCLDAFGFEAEPYEILDEFPGSGGGGSQVPPSPDRPGDAPHPRPVRHPRRGERLRPHRPGPRPGGLRDRDEIRPGQLCPRGRRREVHPGRKGFCGSVRLRRQRGDQREAQGGGRAARADGDPAHLPPLLALQAADHLPLDGAVVHLHGEERPPEEGPCRHRRRDLDPRLGARPDLRHGREPSRLVHLPPAALGRADHDVLLQGVRQRAHDAGDPRPRGRARP